MYMVNRNLRRRGGGECGQALLRNTKIACPSPVVNLQGCPQGGTIHSFSPGVFRIPDDSFRHHFSHGYFGIQRQDIRIVDDTVHDCIGNSRIQK
jgi:hypothetical protein